jgi:hypothetical protein
MRHHRRCLLVADVYSLHAEFKARGGGVTASARPS